MSTSPDPRHAAPEPPFSTAEQETPGTAANMDPVPDHGETSYVGHDRLRDRVAVVTGGDSGIGRAVALAFAREGADVLIAYLSEHEDAQASARGVEEAGRKAVLVSGDLSMEDECRRVVDEAVRRFGRIDILVNNAAFQGKSVADFDAYTRERVERTFRTNIIAMFDLVRFALPHMQPGGVIVNVGSIQAYQPSPTILDYASTKGAIVAFTKGLAQQMAKRGIRVNCVAPGPVWTPLVAQSFDEGHLEEFGENTPLGRPAQPAELAPAFVFLASDDARYVTGEVLGVTGGRPLA